MGSKMKKINFENIRKNNKQTFYKRLLLVLIVPILLYGESETLNLDANGDGLDDKLIYKIKDLHKYPNLTEPTISIDIKTKKEEYHFDTYYVVYPTISSCGAGCLSISQIRGGNSGLDLEEHYKFDKKRNHWFLYKRIENGNIEYLDESFRIDYIFQTKSSKEFKIKCKKKDELLLDAIGYKVI